MWYFYGEGIEFYLFCFCHLLIDHKVFITPTTEMFFHYPIFNQLFNLSTAFLFQAVGPLHEKGMVMTVLDRAFDVFILKYGIVKRVYCNVSDRLFSSLRKERHFRLFMLIFKIVFFFFFFFFFFSTKPNQSIILYLLALECWNRINSWFGWVSLFNNISTFNAKAILLEEQ